MQMFWKLQLLQQMRKVSSKQLRAKRRQLQFALLQMISMKKSKQVKLQKTTLLLVKSFQMWTKAIIWLLKLNLMVMQIPILWWCWIRRTRTMWQLPPRKILRHLRRKSKRKTTLRVLSPAGRTVRIMTSTMLFRLNCRALFLRIMVHITLISMFSMIRCLLAWPLMRALWSSKLAELPSPVVIVLWPKAWKMTARLKFGLKIWKTFLQ